MIAGIALFAQIAIAVNAPDTVAVCDAVEISVAVRTRSSDPPRLIVPAFGPFDVLRSSPLPYMTAASSGSPPMAEYRFVITTNRPGTYTIGPFEARAGTMTARSRALRLVVRAAPDVPRPPSVVARARVDTSLAMSLAPVTQAETVFVGQQANYEVAVFLNEQARDRMRRNPTFFPPDMQGMLGYDLPPPDASRSDRGSGCFDALVYQRALFPLTAGRFAVAPAQLVYSLPLSASFFSREESYELRTDSAIVVAVDPPLAGRPSDFDGAVGRFGVSARLDDDSGRVGDPMVLTVRVAGTGNIKLLPRPQVQVPWGALVNGAERVVLDSTQRRVRGAKEFDWLLTPRVAGELDTPPIRYPFFDPDARRYDVAIAQLDSVHIMPGGLVAAEKGPVQPRLPIRTVYRGEVDAPATDRPLFWLALALAPIPALSARWRRRKAPVRARPLSGVLNEAARGHDAAALRRAFAAAIAARLARPGETFTAPGSLIRALRRSGVSAAAARDAEEILRELERSAYSTHVPLAEGMGQRAMNAYRHIDGEALTVAELRTPRSALIIMLLIGTALTMTGNVLAKDTAALHFERGVAAYRQGSVGVAKTEFAAAAALARRAPDAWANLGVAAITTGDTAEAVLGWQRALRLDPIDVDVRAQLDAVRPLAIGATGFVAPLPPSATALLALGIWALVWLIAAWRWWRRGPRPVHVLGGGIAIASLLLLAALDQRDRLAGHRLAVTAPATPLMRAPALVAEHGAVASAGEIASVVRREGAWVQLAFDDGRAGWAPATSVFTLDGPPPLSRP